MMNRYIFKPLLTAVFILGFTNAEAQMKTSYFMENSIPRYELNPALTPMRSYINLPLLPIGGLGVSLNNNFLSLNNFIYPYNGIHVTALHSSVGVDQFLNRLPGSPSINADISYNLLGFGSYSRKHNYFWSFGWNLRASADVGMSKDIFRILKDLRNGVHDIQDITVGAMSYMEFSFGFTKPVMDNLVVGGRVKFLMGIAQADATFNQMNVSVTDTYVSANLGGTLRGNIAGYDFSDIQTDDDGAIVFEDLTNFDRFDASRAFGNLGAAIDIGAEMKFLDDRLKASFALNDLGFISWSGKNTMYADMDEVIFEFHGYDMDTGEFDIVTPENSGKFRQTSNSSGYSKRLNTTMNIGGEYSFLDNLLSAGILSHTKFANRVTYSELTLVATVRPTDWFTASLSHSLIHNKAGIFGLALNFHPKWINFFFGLDYIPVRLAKISTGDSPFVYPVRLKSANVYFGLAFPLNGRQKPW